MVKKTLLLLVVYSCYAHCVMAQQSDKNDTDTQWYKGTIILSDGTELHGIIRNNEQLRYISYKENTQQDGFQSFRSFEILSLEYFDNDNNLSRKFQSLATKERKSDVEDIFLLEVLRAYEDFAILSTRDRTVITHKPASNGVPSIGPGGIPTSYGGNFAKTDTYQTEEIYFVNASGVRDLYMSINHHFADRTMYKYITDRGEVHDESLPARYIGDEQWKKLVIYSNENKIRITNRRNLLSLFDYYETIISR